MGVPKFLLIGYRRGSRLGKNVEFKSNKLVSLEFIWSFSFFFKKNKKNKKNTKNKFLKIFYYKKHQIQITQNLENRNIFLENNKMILKNYFQ